MRRIIAIDGPAASGKSTTARDVARALGFVHLNSGLLYRAIAWRAVEQGWDERSADLERRLADLHIELVPHGDALRVRVDGGDPGTELQAPPVAESVSRLSTSRAVRQIVLTHLREAGRRFDLVCDGRDIGTTVFPGADLKVFLVADLEERARRRLLEGGREPDETAIRREAARLESRDRRDSTRAASPLRRAPDAVEIDTTELSPEEVVERVVELARGRLGGAATAGS